MSDDKFSSFLISAKFKEFRLLPSLESSANSIINSLICYLICLVSLGALVACGSARGILTNNLTAHEDNREIEIDNAQATMSGIVGGEKVVFEKLPASLSVVRVLAIDRSDVNGLGLLNKSNCTGTLIGERLVLTAGHCVDKLLRKKLFPMKLDPVDRTAQSEGLPVILVGREINRRASSATAIAVPRGYSSENGFATPDIALIKLDRGIQLPSNVPLVKIDSTGLAREGREVRALGFGLTGVDSDSSSLEDTTKEDTTNRSHRNLFAKKLRIVSPTQANWRADHKTADSFFFLPDSEQKSGNVCRGDSGGPIMASAQGQTFVIGVSARSERGCQGVGAATSVARHADWIRKTANQWQVQLFD